MLISKLLFQEVKSDPNFDRGCKIIVNQRIIAHALDFRLRPRLQVSKFLKIFILASIFT